jgi:hypothetical protein
MEPEDSLPCYKIPLPVPVLSQIIPFHTLPHNYIRFILILSSYLCLDLPSSLFPSDFPTKTLYAFLISPMHVYVPTGIFNTKLSENN